MIKENAKLLVSMMILAMITSTVKGMMKKMVYGMALSINLFYGLKTFDASFTGSRSTLQGVRSLSLVSNYLFKTTPILIRNCYKRKGPRTKKVIFLLYKCSTVINAVQLTPLTVSHPEKMV